MVDVRELNELLKISLESKHKQFLDNDLGGGVKVRPPMLKPVGRHGRPPLPSAVNAAEDIVGGWHGGGGVNVHPPKLLCALVLRGALYDDRLDTMGSTGCGLDVLEQQSLIRTNEDDGNGLMSMTEEDIRHAVMETRPLESGEAGYGGVRVFPPKLHVPPHLRAALGDDVTDQDLFDILRSHDDNAIHNLLAHGPLAAEVVSAAQLQECEFPDLSSHLTALATGTLASSRHGGGGIRVRPPKLTSMGDTSKVTRLDEFKFLQDMGLDATTIPAPLVASVLGADGGIFTMEELDGVQEQEGAHLLEVNELAIGRAGGGGVRLKPPKLVSVGLSSATSMAEQIQFLHDMGANPSDIAESMDLQATSDAHALGAVSPLSMPEEAVMRTSSETLMDLAGVELAPLSVESIGTGWHAGGGVRLAPPKLMSCGGRSTIIRADEIEFMRDMGVGEAIIAEKMAAIGGADKAHTSHLQHSILDVPNMLESLVIFTAPLQINHLAKGSGAGGGVRLPPPKLLPMGLDSVAARTESIQFMQEMGVDVLRANDLLNARRAELEAIRLRESSSTLIESDTLPRQQSVVFGGGAVDPPLMPGPIKRNSTRELLMPNRGGSSKRLSTGRRERDLVRRTSDRSLDGDAGGGDSPLLAPVARREPPKPIKDAKTIKMQPVNEGWDGGGGARIAPGLLGAVGGRGPTRAHGRRGSLTESPSLPKSLKHEASSSGVGDGQPDVKVFLREKTFSSFPTLERQSQSKLPPSPPPSPPYPDSISPTSRRQLSQHLRKAGRAKSMPMSSRIAPSLAPRRAKTSVSPLAIQRGRTLTQVTLRPAPMFINIDEDDDVWDDVHAMPHHLLRTLRAEAIKLRGLDDAGLDDALKLAADLVDAYRRASSDISTGLAHHQPGKLTPSFTMGDDRVERRANEVASLTEAIKAATRDDRVVGSNGIAPDGMDTNLARAIAELREEIANIDTGLCPPCCYCCSSSAKKSRGKVAPAPVLEYYD